MKQLLIIALALLTLLLFPQTSKASLSSQFHFRSGMVAGKFTGPISDKFMVPTALDIEFESFTRNNRSLVVSLSLAHNFSISKANYIFAGAGQRFYLGSKGMRFERIEGGVKLSANPTLRYFVGWQAILQFVRLRLPSCVACFP